MSACRHCGAPAEAPDEPPPAVVVEAPEVTIARLELEERRRLWAAREEDRRNEAIGLGVILLVGGICVGLYFLGKWLAGLVSP